MADVTDSKSVGGDTVWVQVPLPALQSDNQSDRKGPVWETVQVLFLCRKKTVGSARSCPEGYRGPRGIPGTKGRQIGRDGLGDEARTAGGQRLPIMLSRGGFLAYVCRMDGVFCATFRFPGAVRRHRVQRSPGPKEIHVPFFCFKAVAAASSDVITDMPPHRAKRVAARTLGSILPCAKYPFSQ